VYGYGQVWTFQLAFLREADVFLLAAFLTVFLALFFFFFFFAAFRTVRYASTFLDEWPAAATFSWAARS
jgi:hypothetical protein